jgi:hypothetical protein
VTRIVRIFEFVTIGENDIYEYSVPDGVGRCDVSDRLAKCIKPFSNIRFRIRDLTAKVAAEYGRPFEMMRVVASDDNARVGVPVGLWEVYHLTAGGNRMYVTMLHFRASSRRATLTLLWYKTSGRPLGQLCFANSASQFSTEWTTTY